MIMKTLLMMIMFLSNVTHGVSTDLVKILFQDKINDARCSSRCSSLPDSSPQQIQCLSVCRLLIQNQEDDLCSLRSVCTGGCRVACQYQPIRGEIQKPISNVKMEGCSVEWTLEDEDDGVVFVVVGRDQGGKWNLIQDNVKKNMVEMSMIEAEKMLEVQILAVNSDGVVDTVSLDIRDNQCVEAVPQPVEWKEDRHDDDVVNNSNNNMLAIIILSCVSAVASVCVVAVVVVRVRSSMIRTDDDDLELPYSPPVKYPAACHVISPVTESRRCLPTIPEDDEYEEIQISSSS